MHFPVVDIGSLLGAGSATERHEAARQFHAACTTTGLCQLTGHGIDTRRVVQRMAEFFALPQADKDALATAKGALTRGYIGMGEESGSAALEVKEAFSCGWPWPEGVAPHNAMQGPNRWPHAALLPPGWQCDVEAAFARFCEVSNGLARAIALAHGQAEDALLAHCRGGETISMLRLFHYLPYAAADRRHPGRTDRIGSSAHTDWGLLTLIVQQEGVSGLQVCHEGAWHDVPAVPGALVVNCGDYGSLCTGGRYVSPLHRVVSDGRERLSAVFFSYPAHEANIPVLGDRDYSLFHDQRGDGGRVDRASIAGLPFGAYLAAKWQQVQREG